MGGERRWTRFQDDCCMGTDLAAVFVRVQPVQCWVVLDWYRWCKRWRV